MHVASDGQAGVEMAASIEPGPHPDGRGDAAPGRLRRHPADPRRGERRQRVPIIMLTAEADVEQRVKGLRAGADDDIVKPFHPLELIARIKALLARSARRRSQRSRRPRSATLGRLACFYRRQGRRRHHDHRHQHRHRARGAASAQDARSFDANLQFGDMRVFLDLSLDSSSIVNAISEPDLDAELLKKLLVDAPRRHRPAARAAEPRVGRHRGRAPADRSGARSRTSSPCCAARTTTRSSTWRKAIDDFNLQLFDEADVIFVVMTADLSCLKNVRLVLETMDSLGYEREQDPAGPEPIERVHRHQRRQRGVGARTQDRLPDHQRVPRRDQRPQLRRAVHVVPRRMARSARASASSPAEIDAIFAGPRSPLPAPDRGPIRPVSRS